MARLATNVTTCNYHTIHKPQDQRHSIRSGHLCNLWPLWPRCFGMSFCSPGGPEGRHRVAAWRHRFRWGELQLKRLCETPWTILDHPGPSSNQDIDLGDLEEGREGRNCRLDRNLGAVMLNHKMGEQTYHFWADLRKNGFLPNPSAPTFQSQIPRIFLNRYDVQNVQTCFWSPVSGALTLRSRTLMMSLQSFIRSSVVMCSSTLVL